MNKNNSRFPDVNIKMEFLEKQAGCIRFRKSYDFSESFRIGLEQLRASFSNTSLVSGNSIRNLNKSPTSITSFEKKKILNANISCLKSKLDALSQKLRNAKMYIQQGGGQMQTKTISNNKRKLEAACVEQQQQAQATERSKASLLSNYLVVIPKPINVLPFHQNPYSSRGNKYFVSEAIRAINEKNSLAMQHVNQTIHMLLQYKLFKFNQLQQYSEQPKIDLPIKYQGPNRKTLILDLDETLVHCFQDSEANADVKMAMQIDGNPFEVGLNIRPYAISFIKKMKKHWELIVFTASHQTYADSILDQIDPDRTIFDHRLYRQHCRQLTTNLYIKDISRLNRDLSQTVLVDNAAYSYAMQLDNGIPILPFYEGKDFQLAALQIYLGKLMEYEDVRTINRQYFQLHQYTSFDNSIQLVNELYCKKFS